MGLCPARWRFGVATIGSNIGNSGVRCRGRNSTVMRSAPRWAWGHQIARGTGRRIMKRRVRVVGKIPVPGSLKVTYRGGYNTKDGFRCLAKPDSGVMNTPVDLNYQTRRTTGTYLITHEFFNTLVF